MLLESKGVTEIAFIGKLNGTSQALCFVIPVAVYRAVFLPNHITAAEAKDESLGHRT